MCLILLAWQQHPDYPLIVAANRDEFYQRPTQAAAYWPEQPQVFAGKDLQAGGTWMGTTTTGRFAAVTNFRHGLAAATTDTKSRGALCTDFLNSTHSPEQYLQKLQSTQTHYAGFNLLVGDGQTLFYFSNQQGLIIELTAGIHGLSNGLLNEDWPKVTSGKKNLQEVISNGVDNEQMLTILADQQPAGIEALPNTGIDATTELMLSSRFIQLPEYGTRCSTVLKMNQLGHTAWLEQSFDHRGPMSRVSALVY
ncbi:MAG: hypothetical protein ACJAYG_000106 [Oceanicoccus sp.]|jgi:uncharacterized protein with NRDE domain